MLPSPSMDLSHLPSTKLLRRRAMKKREFLKAGAGTAAVLASLPAAAQQSGPSYNWKMATGWASGPLMDIGAKAFAERMAQLSGGRFKIQTFPGGALGNALKVP